MGDGIAYADIVVFALAAVFIALRLRGMLGKHLDVPEQPQQKPDHPASSPRRQRAPAGTDDRDNVIEGEFQPLKPAPDAPDEELNALVKQHGVNNAFSSALKSIRQLDSSFRVKEFLEGARTAFEMVLEAYCKADRKTLKMLLSPELLEKFMQEIKTQRADGNQAEVTLIAICRADLTGAELFGTNMRLTVEFETEQVSLVRNKAGDVIEGDPARIDRVVDVWTFERDSKHPDPNWKLVKAEEG
jgi:predicted lipid-binding transport protein (Tim44 family)